MRLRQFIEHAFTSNHQYPMPWLGYWAVVKRNTLEGVQTVLTSLRRVINQVQARYPIDGFRRQSSTEVAQDKKIFLAQSPAIQRQLSLFKSHRQRGHFIEQLVCRWLQQQAIKVIDNNYVGAGGEIDIIGIDAQGWLIFFEVKHRQTSTYGHAAAQVTQQKQERIRRAAAHYLQRKYRHQIPNCRFDVIATETRQLALTWITDAF